MGVTHSTNNYNVKNENRYAIFGTGNSLSDANKSGDLSNSGTTDVKPSTSLKYSEDINPGFGTVTIKTLDGNAKLITTVEHNLGVIATTRHVTMSLLDSSLYDPDVRRKCNVLNSKISSLSPVDLVRGNVQLNNDIYGNVLDCYSTLVDNLKSRCDAWHAMMAISGVRNNDVTTKPTQESLMAAHSRLTSSEKDSAEKILTHLGPRFGVFNEIKQNSNVIAPPDLSSKKIETLNTKYGRFGDLKRCGDIVSNVQERIHFAKLHTPQAALIDARWYDSFDFDTSNLFGLVKESTGYYQHIDVGTGNYRITSQAVPKKTIHYSKTKLENISLLPLCFQDYEEIENRIIYLNIVGTIEIIRGEYKKAAPTRIGVLYSIGNDKFAFQPAMLLGSATLKFYEKQAPPALSVYDDHEKIVQYTEDNLELYNYRSDFYCRIALTGLKRFDVSEIVDVVGKLDGADKISVYVCGTNCPLGKTFIKFGTPSVKVIQFGPPPYITLIGTKFDARVLDLLGNVPTWFVSDDPLDATSIYHETVRPLMPYIQRIATLHTGMDSGSLRLTYSIIKHERMVSDLTDLDDISLKNHVQFLITSVDSWLYQNHEISTYQMGSRIRLFIRLFEVVAFQLLTHIDVYAPRINDVSAHYNNDINEYLKMEERIDEALRHGNKCE